MKKALWYAVNVITGEYAEAIEPITLKRFLTETGFGHRSVKGFYLGESKEKVNRLLGVEE